MKEPTINGDSIKLPFQLFEKLKSNFGGDANLAASFALETARLAKELGGIDKAIALIDAQRHFLCALQKYEGDKTYEKTNTD